MFRLFECCALSFFERFVLSFSLKIERFVSDSAEIWICGLYLQGLARWIKRCTELEKALEAAGYDKNRRFYLKPEVELIVKFLGEP